LTSTARILIERQVRRPQLDTARTAILPIDFVNQRVDSRNELDTMVVNVELTVNSIIQGVALSFLATSTYTVLQSGRISMLVYVFAGLLIVLLFWVRSLIHTLTLMRWPLELGHNCLYFAGALVEVVAFTHLTNPLMWFTLLTVFAAAVWTVFVYDLRVIKLRQEDSGGAHGAQLYAAVLRDQWLNIRFIVPSLFFFNLAAAFVLYAHPDFFIHRDGHLIFGATEAAALLIHLGMIIRSFSKMTPLIAATRQNWRRGDMG
jgi:hypothetical protein